MSPAGFASDRIATAPTALTYRSTAAPTQPPPPGARAVFLGDSITHGSSAAAGQRYVDQLPKILGNAISGNSVERGWPGARADEMLARYDQDVRGNGAQVLFVLLGTNDAGQGRTLAQYAASMKGIAAKARQDGIPVIMGTVPPRSGATASAIHARLLEYNMWLKAWAPANGIKVADVFKALASSTGYALPGGYDSGDGVHPETVAHELIAEAFADAYLALNANELQPHLVDSVIPANLIINPLFLSVMTGWYEQPGGSGTAPSYSIVADTSGKLKWGQWGQMDFDAATGGSRYFCYAANVTPGSKLLITARMDVVDVAGGYYAAARGSNPSAQQRLNIFNGGFVGQAAFGGFTPRPIGPVQAVFNVPAGMTQMILAMYAALPTGQHAKFRIGEVGVFDVTALPDLVAATVP